VTGAQSWFPAFWERYWWVFVKGYHVTEFAVFAVLLYRVLVLRFSHRIARMYSGALSLLYAASDEWHQTFTPYRGGRATDVLIDACGVCLAVGVLALFAGKTRKTGLYTHK
jgi:VanZ family protein